jgi:HEAT repeat protein
LDAELFLVGRPLGLVVLVLSAIVSALVAFAVLRRGSVLLGEWRERIAMAKLMGPLERLLAGDANAAATLAAVGRRRRKLCEQYLLNRLGESNELQRERIIEWLRRHGATARWMSQLSSRDRRTRAEAAEVLRLLRLPESVPALVALLQDADADVRLRAASALSELGGRQARDALLAALGDESRWAVIRVADILSRMGPDVVQDLIESYPGLPRNSRLAALDVITRIGNDSTFDFQLSCLGDPDADTRARAAAGLGRLRLPAAIPPLRVALSDTEWPVRAKAARALGELGALEALQDLAQSLGDRAWWVRSNSAEALRRLGPPGIGMLLRALDGEDRFARDQALAILQASGELERRLRPLVSEPGSTSAGDLGPALAVLTSLKRHNTVSSLTAMADAFNDRRLKDLMAA